MRGPRGRICNPTAWAGAISVALLTIACGRSPTIVATLEQAEATVEKMPGEGEAWQPAEPGATFTLGSGVRTGKASRAHLRVGTRGKLALDPESVVYFRTHDERSEVRVDTGRVTLEAGEEAVEIGNGRLEAGGRAEIARTADGTSIDVKIGRVVLENTTELTAGEQIVVDRNGKRVAAPEPAVRPAPASTASSALVVTVTGQATVRTRTGDSPLAAGEHQLEPGAVIKLPEGSAIDIARGDAHVWVSGPGEVTLGGSPETLATIARGGAALRADQPAAIAVPGGTIAVRGGETSVQVDREGATVANRRGESTIRARSATAATRAIDTKLAAGDVATLSSDGVVAMLPAPPARVVFAIPAGESSTLHDGKAPTPVRLTFPDGCKAGLVEVAKDRALKRLTGRSSGIGGANVLLSPGTSHYRVRCDGGKQLRGTFTVVRDSGRAPLPKTAARTLVEMDGREYTVLYQNLLPQLTLAWRNPAFSVGYTFVLKGSSSEKRIPSVAPKLILKPGELGEGSYRVWVEPQAGARSEASRVVIEFDNTARGVQLDGIEQVDGKLRVRGTVIEGSMVSSTSGAAIDLDRYRRFGAELTPATNDHGAGVRVAHPKLGIHYYVVRTEP